MLWSQFIGGTYQSRSPTLDGEQCVNLMPVTIESATNAKKSMLLGTPGLRRLLSVDTTACRGLFSEDGRTFGVVGDTIYEFDLTANTATTLGTLADDGQPVSFASNGRGGEQLAICGGGELKIFDLLTNTLSLPIALPLTNAPVQLAFLDGYFLLLEAGTVRVWFSALEDGTDWDGLDFFARSQTSDNLVGLAVLRDRIYCFGSQTTDVYYDSGDADTPFIPYPGAIIREGLVGPWAWAIEGEVLYWLAQDDQGRARMVRTADIQAQPISTDAIDFAIAQATDLTDVEALAYWQEGHGHVAWTVPSLGTCGKTYAFDTKESLWHERGSWDAVNAIFFRWRARGVCSTAAGVLVGDYATGELYALDLNTYTENGALIRRVRRAPYLAGEAQWAFVDQIELGAQVGVGLSSGQGRDPHAIGRVSRDGNQTWGPAVSVPLGKIGAYLTRAVWHRLGRVRLDRFGFEVVVTDPVKVVLGPGLQLRITPGSSDL